MANVDPLVFRPARATDSEAIAVLHADSWRRHYRGAYSDAFLDGDVYVIAAPSGTTGCESARMAATRSSSRVTTPSSASHTRSWMKIRPGERCSKTFMSLSVTSAAASALAWSG